MIAVFSRRTDLRNSCSKYYMAGHQPEKRQNKEGKYNMQFELTASMMCADYGNLAQEVKSLEESGIDSFHIDIMDGRYVSNFAMSLNDMRYIAGATEKPLDVHLMIEHPNNLIHLFLKNLRKVTRCISTRRQSIIRQPHYRRSLTQGWYRGLRSIRGHRWRRCLKCSGLSKRYL